MEGFDQHHGKFMFAMELNVLAELGTKFLNAPAFENPGAAGSWWGSAHRHAVALDVRCPGKPRFDAVLTVQLADLQQAARELVGASLGEAEGSAASRGIVNRALGRARPVLAGASESAGAGPAFAVDDGAGSVLFPVAYAISLLLASRPERLRRCIRRDCAAYFWDRTKNNSRRWCSLGCMERERAPRRRLPR